MTNNDFLIGGNEHYARQLVSGWSNHARSWAAEKEFPVRVIKYEDIKEDPANALIEVLEHVGIKVDESMVERAVSAAELSALKKKEAEDGFRENIVKERGNFFNGDTSWEDELGARWINRIEEDHGEVMKLLGYL